MKNNNEPVEVSVKTVPITLGQFLKHASLVQDGFEAKIHIQEGVVQVNGQQETRRGRKLVANDIVFFNEQSYQVSLV